ncbi:Crp/Fnr family transcriptional regulator [Chryseobacterium sp. M5A1_1a]
MFEELIQYINNITQSELTKAEEAEIRNTFAPKRIKKKQFLLHEGTVCQYMSFITKGAMRQYTIDDKGNQHVVGLGIEGWWISDRGSFVNLTPSKYSIDAVEETDLLVTTLEKLNLLKERSSTFLKMVQVLDQNSFVASQKRIEASISFTAEEKLIYLMQNNPTFIQRFPQIMLASYLGMTPETLSRIRKSWSSK